MKIKALMLGSGFSPLERRLMADGTQDYEVEWTTLDRNPACKPDIEMDLEVLDGFPLDYVWGTKLLDRAPFDEIHCYETIEHFGRQGDFRGFFRFFRNMHTLLKKGGVFYASTPGAGTWVWGDPGHVRSINHGTLGFLTEWVYDNLGHSTGTDYREYVAPQWWKIRLAQYVALDETKPENTTLMFALETL